MAVTASDLAEIVTTSLSAFHAPSATVAVTAGADTLVGTGGRRPVNDHDALYEVGSITKTMVTALIMQQVASGTVDLDDPVARFVPWLALAHPDATARVTIRHLLTHSSGIDIGDDCRDTGDDDQCIRHYVEEAVNGSQQLSEPGERFSYANGGFILLGHVVELLYDRCWDDVLMDEIIRPCEMSGGTRYRLPAGTRITGGHITDHDTGIVTPTDQSFPRSTGPAGGILVTAADLIRFARRLMAGGLVPEPWLSAMWQPQVASATGLQGLGWMIFDPDPLTVMHGGSTIGYTALLALRPESGEAVAVTATGEGAPLVGWATGLAAFTPRQSGPPASRARQPPPAGETPVDPSRCIGTFARRGVQLDFTLEDDVLVLRSTIDPVIYGMERPLTPRTLHQVADASFEGKRPFETFPTTWTFSDPGEDGRMTRVFSGRLAARTD